MDIRDLSDDQVNLIIEELKLSLAHLDFNSLNTPFGRVSLTNDILSQINGIEFRLDIYRGNKEPNRFNINLRFSETNDTLVRLDINGGTHQNPDGTVAPNSHVHIYNSNYGEKDAFAYPVKLEDFPNIRTFYDASVSFLDYTNINNNQEEEGV